MWMSLTPLINRYDVQSIPLHMEKKRLRIQTPALQTSGLTADEIYARDEALLWTSAYPRRIFFLTSSEPTIHLRTTIKKKCLPSQNTAVLSSTHILINSPFRIRLLRAFLTG